MLLVMWVIGGVVDPAVNGLSVVIKELVVADDRERLMIVREIT